MGNSRFRQKKEGKSQRDGRVTGTGNTYSVEKHRRWKTVGVVKLHDHAASQLKLHNWNVLLHIIEFPSSLHSALSLCTLAWTYHTDLIIWWVVAAFSSCHFCKGAYAHVLDVNILTYVNVIWTLYINVLWVMCDLQAGERWPFSEEEKTNEISHACVELNKQWNKQQFAKSGTVHTVYNVNVTSIAPVSSAQEHLPFHLTWSIKAQVLWWFQLKGKTQPGLWRIGKTKYIFSFCLKPWTETCMCNDKGREFQRLGAQMLKAHDPATVLTLGSTSKLSTLTPSECGVRDWLRKNGVERGRLAGLQYFTCQ